ncbi:hypothetical protein TBLA_0B01890 [Henningerozyma blattae CBS 6284]|uniref:Membrane insertase YidC/Oxa/ALB C-terminal domain-containing protein n=1 Tax=Henningerozyma blattae (strain ATCC 34711 / CBS 6284 / DSM 70876 / NBRC 10599 / NRRL Y-10934 / UCD 77-7) TaxID=1071380 RepID=I2GY31_HENB6|nr:hypothetical protein TBLA_0B01890 [Tetrapisispora blattae CBS 6284]CCH59033.1 hypothetical protein TBLA_0B01890 [Tetrapisispora blattae CBS 6284]
MYRSSLLNVQRQFTARQIFRSSLVASRPKISLSKSLLIPGLNLSVRWSSNTPNADSIDSSTTQAMQDIQSSLPSMDEIASTGSTILDQTSGIIGEASYHLGYLNSIGMANNWWRPTDLIQNLLELTHVYTGLPWWGTICTLTIVIRLLLVPLFIKSSDTVARNSRIKPQLDIIGKKMSSATDLSQTQLYNLERKQLLAKHGIKNRWLIAPMIQLPIALGFFGALRHMANYPVDGFTNQGILWFTDLSQADPFLGLQIITAAVYISFTRAGGETGAQQFSPVMKKVFTLLPLISIPATMKLSSAVVLYFAINGSISVLQTFLLKNKWVRHKLKIADVVHHPVPQDQQNKSILQTMKDSMAKGAEKSKKRREMQEQENKNKERVKKYRENSTIKIVSKKNFNKKNSM